MKKYLNFIHNKNCIKTFISVLCLAFWIFFTIKNPYMQGFNTDEFWAYDIASDLNFIEIIKLMHYEGHTFLWYIVLKPFTYFPQLFPQIIKYLNWLFCLFAMLLFWFLAPIKSYIKIPVTVSSPFLIIYPMLGRCYGLALFLLFLMTILYKNRLKRPILFSIIIFFATNSCINAAFLTFIISIFFIYDILKLHNWSWKHKNVLLPAGIILSSFLMLIIQWFPIVIPQYISFESRFWFFKNFFFPAEDTKLQKLISFFIFVPLFVLTIYLNIINIKIRRYFIIGFFLVNIILFFNFFISVGRNYHFYFLYIYLIILYWLIIDNYPGYKSIKPAYWSYSILIIAISLLFNAGQRQTNFWFQHIDVYNSAVNKILTFVPKGSVIYIELDLNQWIVPYIKNNYKLLTSSGDKIPSYKAYKNIYRYKKAISPKNINTSEKENSYYIISKKFITMYSDFIDIAPIDKSCIILNNSFYLCKLPLKKRKTYSGIEQIEAFIPKNSVIYIDKKVDSNLKKRISKKYAVITAKPLKNNNKYENTYFLQNAKYIYKEINPNCIIINEQSLLCKIN